MFSKLFIGVFYEDPGGPFVVRGGVKYEVANADRLEAFGYGGRPQKGRPVLAVAEPDVFGKTDEELTTKLSDAAVEVRRRICYLVPEEHVDFLAACQPIEKAFPPLTVRPYLVTLDQSPWQVVQQASSPEDAMHQRRVHRPDKSRPPIELTEPQSRRWYVEYLGSSESVEFCHVLAPTADDARRRFAEYRKYQAAGDPPFVLCVNAIPDNVVVVTGG